MAQSNINPQIGFSLYANLFAYDNAAPQLLDLDRNWTQVWQLMNVLNAGTSVPISDNAGKYLRPIKKRAAVMAQISVNATQLGANLVVTFTDPNYSAFRVKDVVKDDNMNEGRVISTTNGTITIEPTPGTPTLTSGTHFLAASFVRAYFDASGNFNSLGKTNLFRDVIVQTDYTAVTRDSCQMARREKFKTHVATNGIAYLYTDGETEMNRRFMKNYGKKVMFSEGGTYNSVVEGATNLTRGVRRSVISDGAAYVSGTADISQAVFENLLYSVANTDGRTDQQLTLLMGRSALMKVQKFYSNFVTTAGINTTFGVGKSEGLDIRMFQGAGVHGNLILLGCLNDSLEVPAWMSDSIYIIDTTPIPATGVDGQQTTVSPIQKIHYDDGSNSTDGVAYRIITGMTPGGFASTAPSSTNGWMMASNAVDGCSYEIEADNGVSCVLDRSALFEQIR